MIANRTIVINDLERLFNLRSDKMILNLEFYFTNLLSQSHLTNEQFWEKNRDKIRGIFYTYYNMEYYESKSLFLKFFSNYIDVRFLESITLTNSFRELLSENYSFFQYFEWLKRYILKFFSKFQISHFHGVCDYETEIENPDKKRIKIKINLPIDDFDRILDLLERFIETQEFLLTQRIPSLVHCFKRTFFIFRTFQDELF